VGDERAETGRQLQAYLQRAEAKGGLAPLVGALRAAIADHAAGKRAGNVKGVLIRAKKVVGGLAAPDYSITLTQC
jgi:hypothetical protein